MDKVGIDVYQKGLDAYIDLMTELYELRDENERLKQEIKKWKDKYYDSEKTVIYEYSSDIASDIKELDKEVYGE